MQRADIKQESRAFRLFKNSINSEKTLDRYCYSLDKFCEYASLSYDEIVKLDTEELQIKLEDWIMSMKQTGLRRSSIRTHLAGVEKFLDINRKLYYKKVLHSLITKDKDLGGGGKPFTNEDIQKMLSVTNKPRTKSLVLFLSSTGTRPQALVDPILRKKHLVDMQNGCYAVRVYDNSTEGYWAFLTPEARQALDAYFSSRKLNGERITDESPLFVNLAKHAKQTNLTVENMYQMLAKLYRQATIEREKIGNRYDKALTYGFRKRFNTILKINNEVNSNIAEKLMAHKRGLDGSYLTPTREECFKEFIKAIPELTVSDSERLQIQSKIKDEKITKLESEKDKKISTLEEITRQLSERLQKQESMTAEISKIHLKTKETMNRESDPSNPHYPDGGPFDTRLVNLEMKEINDKSMVIFDTEFEERIEVVLRKDKVYCTLDKSSTCKHVLFALGNSNFYQLLKKHDINISLSTVN